MQRWRINLLAAMACAVASTGCFSVSVQRKCLDCGGPMTPLESASYCSCEACLNVVPGEEDDPAACASAGPSAFAQFTARLQATREDCVLRVRRFCSRPEPPLAPPVARYHPVPTRPVFSPAGCAEPPVEAPTAPYTSGPGEMIDSLPVTPPRPDLPPPDEPGDGEPSPAEGSGV